MMAAPAFTQTAGYTIRGVQKAWADESVPDRLRTIRKIRGAIAQEARTLAELLSQTPDRCRSESLTAEIIPLAEACRFLEVEAERILSPRLLSSRGRPLWLRGVDIEIHHEPMGVVLIIGPSNYPLLLPGVQALQALVAGNAVTVKPGRGGKPVMDALRCLAIKVGLPHALFTVLDEEVESATMAIRVGVEKIVVTGSLTTGKAVLREAAEQVTPVVAELSGDDAVFVFGSADLEKAAAAIAFGCKLNGGQTCIAPRRVFAHEAIASRLGAISPGTRVLSFATEEEALDLARRSPYALGASVFGDKAFAKEFAKRIPAGVVVINDMIVPTADPRMPFGGRSKSGFGKTRGAEGLLEMTSCKAVVVQRAARLRHLEPLLPNSEDLFLAYLSAKHGPGLWERLLGWRNFGTAIARVRKAHA